MVRVVIVEDDPDIRADLVDLVGGAPGFEVAGVADAVGSGLKKISEIQPDVVLLDIQLKGENAFNLLDQLRPVRFHVIFVTAFEHHAIKAIKYGALDYLLTPVDEQELVLALQKTVQSARDIHIGDSLDVVRQNLDGRGAKPRQLVLRTHQAMHVVQFSDILFCKSESCYTTFYLRNKTRIVVSKPIKTYEELLPEDVFLRPHQSYIINSVYIQAYLREGYLLLEGEHQIPVSVRKREHVVNFLNR